MLLESEKQRSYRAGKSECQIYIANVILNLNIRNEKILLLYSENILQNRYVRLVIHSDVNFFGYNNFLRKFP